MWPGGKGLLAPLIVVSLLQACFVAREANAQSGDLLALMQRIGELSKAGRYTDALPLGRQLVAEAEKMAGKEHPLAAIAVFTLADLHRLQGQLDVAEPMLERVLAIRQKALGPDHQDVAQVLASLSYIAIERARYAEAERYLKRALVIRERELGSDHPDTAMTLVSIARVRHREARYDEAETLLRQALEAFRKSVGPEHIYVSVALNNLAEIYKEQGRLALAEKALREALAIQEKAFGSDSVAAAAVANNLGGLHVRQGRYPEAETLYRRTLQITERALGPDHPDVANQLSNLATLFTYQGRAREAEGLLSRALAITEKTFGPEHPDVATRANNLAHAVSAQKRPQEAEALYRRSLAIREAQFGRDSVSVAIALDNLAALLHQERRFAEAEPLARRSLAIREQSLGSEHRLIGNSLNNLASILDNLRRHDEAGPLLRRALVIREAALGENHPEVAVTVHNLASHHLDLHEWDAAYAAFKRAITIWIGRRSTGSGASEDGQRTEMRNNADPFLGLIVAGYHVAESARGEAALKLRAEAFESAQWVVGASAASAIARMSARVASRDSGLAELVRERQDLVEQATATDRALIVAASQPAQARNSDAEAELLRRATAHDVRLKEIDATLAARFPEYATLTGAAPVPLADAASLVRPDEALLLFVPTKDDTYLWAVTRSQSRWVKIAMGAKALAEHVKALRCGLDYVGEWQDGGAQRCMELLGLVTPPGDAGYLPFDLARALQLYRALFGQIEDLVVGKHLQIVASGALASIPFHVLVASEPKTDARTEQGKYARADWLARRVAISILPSVASLRALRQFAQQSQATSPFVGFGNPLLLGRGGADRRAWAKQSCPATGARGLSRVGGHRLARPASAAFRGALADVEILRRQEPLPETADELCTVAHLLGAPDSSVYLGANATERTLKALSARGELKRARILHFATHGLLAGEAEGVAHSPAEPALMLTPPQQASEEDDGLLTASEVAQLKLDADWVIMSACNTAAGDKFDAEALSGLARAFFYAGSRALLVSHWYVDSHAAVATTNGAFAQLKANPSIGRAEALRRSMLALIDKGGRDAHPAYWAPFVVVGDGNVTVIPAGSPMVTSAVPSVEAKSLARRAAPARKAKGADWRSEIWKQ